MFLASAWIVSLALFFGYLNLCAGGMTPRRRLRISYGYVAFSTLTLFVTPLLAGLCSLVSWDSLATVLHYAAYYCFGIVAFGMFLAVPSLALAWVLKRRLESRGGQLPGLIVVTLIMLPLLAGAAASGYAIWEARHVRVRHLTLTTPKMPGAGGPLRLAVLTDLHLENPVRYGLLKELARKSAEQKPDLILCLGDMVVGPISDPQRVARALSRFKATQGSYYIYGNHEMLTNRGQPVHILDQAGFTALINRGITVGCLNLIGVTDALEDIHDGEQLPPLIDNGLFTILMEHRPLVSPANLPFFDLQISGHTHGGQIWPFMLLMKLRYPYINGLYGLGDHKWILTSPGAGTHGPPLRFLAPPEITIIDLAGEQGPGG